MNGELVKAYTTVGKKGMLAEAAAVEQRQKIDKVQSQVDDVLNTQIEQALESASGAVSS